MNTPEPAREIDLLLDRIVAAINGIYLLDEAALDAMAWQAKKCKRTDPGDARMVLALIADIRQDGKAAEQHFEEALRYGWYPLLGMNYATTLRRFNRVEDALHQIQRVIDQGPGHYFLSALDSAVQCAYFAGRFHRTSELIATLCQYNAPLSREAEAMAETMLVLMPAVEHLGLTDEATAAATEQARSVIRRFHPRARVSIDDFIGQDDHLFLSRTLLVPVSFEEARRMDLELMALQAESDIPLSTFCVSLRDNPAA